MSNPIPKTAAEFDAALSALPAGTTIELEAGALYWTRGYLGGPGDLDLKAGTKIIGNGATLKLDRNPVFHSDVRPDPATRNLTVLRGVADDIEVLDLTLDANFGNETVSQFGMHLGGNNCIARKVKLINLGGRFDLRQESFGISVGSDKQGGSTVGGLISDCEVSSCRGTYVSAINMTGEGRIKNNRVIFPVITAEMNPEPKHAYFQGILPAGSSNCVVGGNLVEGGVSGIYGDTGSEVNLTIDGNVFYNVCLGIAIVKSPTQQAFVDGLLIRGNTILLSTEVCDYDRGGIRIVYDGPQFYRNISALDNRIGWIRRGGAVKGAYAFCVWSELSGGQAISDVTISDNQVESALDGPPLDWRLKCKNLSLPGNRDWEGQPINPSLVSISQ